MGGWLRLYIFLCALVVAPFVAFWTLQKPEEGASRYVAYCQTPRYATPTDAKNALGRTDYDPSPGLYASDCAASLRAIATGDTYRDDVARWKSDVKAYASVFGGLLALIFALGWGIGWVYRGFARGRA